MSIQRMSPLPSQRSKKPFDIRQVKSENQEQEHINKQISQWYENRCMKIINTLPSDIPQMKNSEPFRLVIQSISNIHSIKKPSIGVHYYIHVSATFMSDESTLVGMTGSYQCQIPVSDDGKYQYPICFYYHSRIDRAYSKIKILIRFSLKQIRDGIVESITLLSIGIINNPFTQEEAIGVPAYRQCSEIELITQTIQKLPVSTLTYSFYIQSKLELKNLIKFIPSQFIVSPNDHISGLSEQFPPSDKNRPVQDGDFVLLNIKICQIHIPDKVQNQILASLKTILGEKVEINERKIICGFHNQFQFVLPIVRKLEQIGKQSTGQYTVQIYQAITENEVIKIPYYTQSNQSSHLSALGLSLVYTIQKIDYQIAILGFSPQIQGTMEELSVKMVTGVGRGLVGNMLPLKNLSHGITLILQYRSEEGVVMSKKVVQSERRIMKSSANFREGQQYLKQLERERLNHLREKQELEILKTQNYIRFQEQFEKKLLEEKEQLKNRQEMIENQYRQEVQRQIREKIQLENQIRAMKERIAAIEDYQKDDGPSKKISYNQSVAEPDPNFQFLNFNSKLKVNPQYLIEQQKTMPVHQIREIMSKNFQLSKEAYEKELKNFTSSSKFTILFNSVIWSPHINPPKSIYLKIKFFNFKQFVTDPLTYIESNSDYHQLVRLTHYLYNLEKSSPSYEFVVDPSQYANPSLLQEDLVEFLAKNNTIVDIFDADNFLYIGQINIKMNQLFRGSKSQVLLAKQFNLLRLKGQQNYGTIQILMKNEMAQCKQQISLVQKRPKRQVTKKVVSNNPILLTKQVVDIKTSTTLTYSKNNTRNKQEHRIQMFKKKASEAKQKNSFDQIENHEKANIIEKIHQYKQKKMPNFIQKVYQDLLTQRITINPYYGQTKTFLYQFTNISQSPSSFRVSFQGAHEELVLIKDSDEWKYFANMNRYPTPKIYDCINNENSFYLSPGQTIPLVFKYLSFKKQETNKQTATVTITKQENNWIVGGFALNIFSHQSIINHSYILYQPGNQVIDLIIPVVYSSNDTRLPKRLFLTIEEASAEWINEYQIMLRVKTSQIMSKMKFNMLLYEDDFFCELKENWEIQIFVYEGVYAVSKADERTKFKISLPEQVISQVKPLRVELHSNHQDLVFNEQVIEGVKLARGSVEIWCHLVPGKLSSGSIQITCVTENKQLLYGWIVQIYPYSAKVA